MVISDSPQGGGVAAAAESDLRRRPIAKSDADSDSKDGNLVTDSTSSEDSANIAGDDSKARNEASVDSGAEDKKKKKKSGEDRAVKFAYRPSEIPAHRKIKESPLSSDAIF